MTWTAGHAHCLYFFGPYTQTVKESHQGVELPLKAGNLRQHKKSVIGTEKLQEGLDCHDQALLSGALLWVPHYRHPVMDDTVNNHVNDCG